MIKSCTICNNLFETNYPHTKCCSNECSYENIRQKNRGYKYSKQKRIETYRHNKIELVTSLGGKCQICGYDKYLGALEFHHIDPSTKADTTKTIVGLRREDRFAEIRKCALLCSNCHREVEAGIAQLAEAPDLKSGQ